MKNLLYKGRVTRSADLARYDMPLLREAFSQEDSQELSVGRSVDHIEREAYEQGYASGEKSGFDMGMQKAQVMLDKLDGLMRELTTLRSVIVREVEPQCVELAVSIARKIIVSELTTRPEVLVNMAKEGLLRLERTGQITIKVNPALYDYFTKHKPDLVKIHPDIVFDADPSVTQYGAVVMGPVEDVVTDVDEQLKNLIKDMVARHGAD